MTQLNEAWTEDDGAQRATDLFTETYDDQPDGVWMSPGRVNVIGDHVDYNDGLCLPIALPHATYAAARRRDDNTIRLVTGFDGGQRWEGTLAEIGPGKVEGWVAYAAGPIWALAESGVDVPGLDVALVSCVPYGAGLSSSASVESAVLLAAAELAGALTEGDKRRAELAAMGVRAENEVAGAPTGGMDQASSLRAVEGHGLLLDCLDDSVTQTPLGLDDLGLSLLVVDSKAPHMLTDGQYGERRAACERARDLLGLSSLRVPVDEQTPETLPALLEKLPDEKLQRRLRHVVTESWRVRDFVTALGDGRADEAGVLMTASHESLRDDYETSVAATDRIVESSVAAGALGARMTGGGFGGSCVVLVPSDELEAVADAIQKAAADAGGPMPEFHRAYPAAGGHRVR